MSQDRSVIFLLAAKDGTRPPVCDAVEASLGRTCRCVTRHDLLQNQDCHDPACVIIDADDAAIDLDRTVNDVSNGHGFPVLVLRAKPSVDDAVNLIRRGAFHYLPASSSAAVLRRSVADALEADGLGHRLRLRDIRRRHSRLTRREREVMELVVQGMPNKRIAEKLDVSVKTVEVHRSRVMRKMEASSLPALVRDAIALETVQRWTAEVGNGR